MAWSKAKHRTVCVGLNQDFHSYDQCPRRIRQCRVCKHKTIGLSCRRCLEKSRARCRDEKFEAQVGVEVSLSEDSFAHLGSVLNDSSSHLAGVMKEVVDSTMSDLTQNVSTHIDRVVANLTALLPQVAAPCVALVARAVVAVALLWKLRGDSSGRLLAISNLCGVFGLDLICAQWILELFGVGVVGQSGRNWFIVILSLVHIFVLGSKPALDAISQFVVRFARVGAQVDSLALLADSVTNVLTSLKDWFMFYMCGFEVPNRDVICNRFVNWAEEIDKVFVSVDRKRGVYTVSTIALLDKLYQDGMEMKRELRFLELDGVLQRNFVSRFSLLQKMLDEVASSGARQQTRKEPYMVYLAGASGCGKSLLVPYFAIRYLAQYHKEELRERGDYTSFVFTRTAGDPRWDGVGAQCVYVYDDYAQALDSMGNPNAEFMETIRLSNTVPFVPEMAELSKKGRVQLAPELVLHTSNTLLPSVHSLAHAEAVYRRFDMVAVVQPNEFLSCDGRLSERKVREWHGSRQCGCDGESDICLRAVQFVRHYYDATSQQFVARGSAITVEELVECMLQEVAQKRDLKAGRKEFYSSLIEKFTGQVGGDDSDVFEDAMENVQLQDVVADPEVMEALVEINRVPTAPVTRFRKMVMNRMEVLVQHFVDWVDKHPWLTFVLGLAGRLIFSLLITRIIRACAPKGEFCGESSQAGKAKRKRQKARKQEVKFSAEGLVAQGVSDPNLWPLQKKIMRSVVSLSVGTRKLGLGLIVKGRVLLTVNHFELYITDMVTVQYLVSGNRYTVKWSDLQVEALVVDGKKTDLMAVGLPRICPAGPDLSKHFVSGDFVVNSDVVDVRLLANRDLTWLQFTGVAQHCATKLSYDCGGVSYSVPASYYYDFDTICGDCGSVLFCGNGQSSGCLLGMHIAGSAVRSGGCASIVTTTMVEAVLKKFDWYAQMGVPELGIVDYTIREDLALVGGLGMVEKGINDPVHSKIRPSPLHGVISEPRKKPALLGGIVNGVPVSNKSRQKLAWFGCAELDDEVLCVVRARAVARFASKFALPLWSVEEACFGGSEPYQESLDMNTSPGYPWVLTATKVGKKSFLDIEGKEIAPTLLAAVRERVRCAEIGVRTPTIWSDHLKDETRSIDGEKYNSPRLFAGAPLDFTIVCRQYFGAFCASVMQGRILNGVCVGINPHGPEWTMLARYMLEYGPRFYCGDFKNFDGTLHPQLLDLFCEVVNLVYDDEHVVERRVLFEEIVNACHLTRTHVYQMDHGNPSGNPLTAILNSVYLLMAFDYVLLKEFGVTWDIDSYVRVCVYGDDSVCAIRDCAVDGEVLSKLFDTHLGMTLTDGDKKGSVRQRDFSTVEFLSRTFREERGVYFAPRDWGALVEIFNWVKSKEPWEYLARVYLDVALFELSHYSPAQFLFYSAKIIKVYRERKLMMPPLYPIAYYRAVLREGRGPQFLAYQV